MGPRTTPLLEWRLVPFESESVPSVVETLTPFIDGQPLDGLVAAYERQRGYEPAGMYAGLSLGQPPDAWRSHLFGAQPDWEPGWPQDRVPLLGCSCSDVGCWPLLARVVSDGGVVRWDRFLQPHRRSWDYDGFGPFEFDAGAYAGAVEHALAVVGTRR